MDLSGIHSSLNRGDDSQRPQMRIQIFCPLPSLPNTLRSMIYRKDVQCSWVLSYEAIEKYHLLDDLDLLVFFPGPIHDVNLKRRIGKLLSAAQHKSLPVILLSDDDSISNIIPPENEQIMPRIQMVPPEIATDELWGRIFSMLNFNPVFDRIEDHMKQLEKWAFSLNSRFEQLHQELRLAWRVQQDFLPKKLPHTLKITFAALYRPATWVSGDIYDIFKLDEKNIGFYIADVVGHGVAAGLMTLFVKRALITKEILGNSYQILPPNQALARLNDEICSLELPEHQFVTAAYGIINTETRELTFARAGHPRPLVFDRQGKLSYIETEGALLGIFPSADFGLSKTVLEPGSRLILYTDGLEQGFGRDSDEKKMIDEVSRIARLPVQDMIDSLTTLLDCQENSLNPEDDITAIALEILA
jgi:serine phosphatase RsbU (regulator of sigma subunit)